MQDSRDGHAVLRKWAKPTGGVTAKQWRTGVMPFESIIVLLIVGAIAGWLAGVIMKGFGFGLIGNIIVGIVGAAIASWLFPRLGVGLPAGIVGAIIAATIGAVILLFIIGLVKRA
jgi:uncharacterized membrane protein YeaQ/YmgE (transglycosylase-associated protein family)